VKETKNAKEVRYLLSNLEVLDDLLDRAECILVYLGEKPATILILRSSCRNSNRLHLKKTARLISRVFRKIGLFCSTGDLKRIELNGRNLCDLRVYLAKSKRSLKRAEKAKTDEE
jgi:hypothetical protein